MLYDQPLDYRVIYIIHYVGLGYMFSSWVIDGCHLFSWAVELSRHRGLTVFSFSSCHEGYPQPLKFEPDPEGAKQSQLVQEADLTSIPFSSHYYLAIKIMATLVVTVTWVVCVNWSTDPDHSRQHDNSIEWVSLSSMAGILFLEILVTACIAVCIPLAFPRQIGNSEMSNPPAKKT